MKQNFPLNNECVAKKKKNPKLDLRQCMPNMYVYMYVI
jgi:hypothetical protein